MDSHFTRLHQKEEILCFQCRASIQGSQNLQEHLRKHQEYSIGCKFCYLSFLSKAELADHVATEHQGKKKQKIHEKPSFVFQSIVNSEKVSAKNQRTNNFGSAVKEFKSVILNVEKSPSPELRLPTIETPISDKSDFLAVIENSPRIESESVTELKTNMSSSMEESSEKTHPLEDNLQLIAWSPRVVLHRLDLPKRKKFS